MRKRKPDNRKLSVYLMKPEHQDFGAVIKGSPDEYEVRHDAQVLGILYIKQLAGGCPAWFSLFDGSVPADLRGRLTTRNVSAVFLFRRARRVFALTFGYGRHLLVPGTWEERFGLKVVLNSIDREKVRIIDRKNLDTMLTQTRTQTSRECAIEEFGLDPQQILLKAVTGEPRNVAFASRVAGADALSITCQVTLDTIESKCDDLLKSFSAEDYRASFPWVDNLSEVGNKQTVQELDEEMVSRIKVGNLDHLYLAVPDIVDWTDIEGFRFRNRDDQVRPDVFLPDFLETLRRRDELTRDHIKHRRVFMVHASTGVAEALWSVYHCLNCEISLNGMTYILTDGKWYEVDTSFVARVNTEVGAIAKHGIDLPAETNEREADYCRRLQESDTSQYALMDGQLIRYGGAHSQMEFCDLFTADKKLIHLKRYAGSSVLSHLFAQGANSARTFLADAEFRSKVNAKLPASHRFNAGEQPRPQDYEIVFGIISQTADELPAKLPFFSKVTLIRVVQELQVVMRFKVSLAGIRLTPRPPSPDLESTPPPLDDLSSATTTVHQPMNQHQRP